MLFDAAAPTPLPTNLVLCYRDNLQERPFEQGNRWETVRVELEGGVSSLPMEQAARCQYPVVKAAVCNTLAHMLAFGPEQQQVQGDGPEPDAAFSWERFEAGVSMLQLQVAEAFPSPFPDPMPLDGDGADGSGIFSDVDIFGLPSTAFPEPTFHTTQLQLDFALHPAALFSHLRQLVHASGESAWRGLVEHVLHSRLSTYRNEVLCAYEDDEDMVPLPTNPLLPAAFGATLATLWSRFAGATITAPLSASAVGIDGGARVLALDLRGALALCPLSELARRRSDDDGGGGVSLAAQAVLVVTPAGPRRVLAFLAARVDAASCRLARLPTSTQPLLILPTSGGGGGGVDFDLDDCIWFSFPTAKSPSGSGSGGLLISEAQPVALQGEAFHSVLDREAGLFAWAEADGAEPFRYLWTLLLEPDANPEAHVVLIEGYRVMTVGHPSLSGNGSAATPFGEYNTILLNLSLLERVPGYGVSTYLVNGIRRDAKGMVELY